MINISYNPNFLLSIILIMGMLLFYSLRIVRPEVSKEEDVFFTSLGLLYSCIILIHGWRLDPILFFSQVLLVGIVLGIGWENIRLRGLLVRTFEIEN
jgi:Ycf66 protein N-terminus